MLQNWERKTPGLLYEGRKESGPLGEASGIMSC